MGHTPLCGSCARPAAAFPSTGRCAARAASSTPSSSRTWRPRSRCSRCAATGSTPPSSTATSSCPPTPSGSASTSRPGTGPGVRGAAAHRRRPRPAADRSSPTSDTPYVLETVKILAAELPDDVPLLAFAGAPFTVASYLIEGRPSRTYEHTKALMHTDPALWHAVMRAARAARRSASIGGQLDHGARRLPAVRLVGRGAEPRRLRHVRAAALARPCSPRLAASHPGVPGIHFGIGCDHLLESMHAAGPRVLGLDWRTSITDARRRMGADLVVQGNLDPALVLAGPTRRWPAPMRCSPTTAATPATSSTSATACTRHRSRRAARRSSITSRNAPRR